MEGRKCECDAIHLIVGLTEALDASEQPGGDDMMGRAAKNILRHLDNRFRDSGYTEREEPYYHLLEEMRASVNLYNFGGSGTSAEEVVRNLIHSNHELKQLMVCGPPYKDRESLSETAKVLVEVFETLENEGPMDALFLLANQYEKLGCATV
ncbi:hypothetical protein LCGC14_2958250 [marine sediment metagenome]|uniref:Uncharacterized protein n=1 Tax=marine sediment metagenome TaxID=412755 RepID=A0A0F8XDU7_9ZZZZ